MKVHNHERMAGIFFYLILGIGVLLHLAGIQQPFLGNFAQHQTDYATVVQRWLATSSINPFSPVTRFIGNGDNRIFFGDLPLTMTLVALVCRVTQWPIELVGRGTSVFFFFISLYPLYRLAILAFNDRKLALWTLLFYGFSPLTIIYGQAFLLEMTALSFGLWGYYFFFNGWYGGQSPKEETGPSRIIFSAIFFSFMLATRIYYAPLLLPIGILFLRRYGWRTFGKKEVYFFFFFAGLLPLLWQFYAGHMAQAHGNESSLHDNLRVFVLADPVLRQNLTNPGYYLAIFKILISKAVTPVGILLVLIGFLFVQDKIIQNAKGFILLIFLSFLPLVLMASRKFVEFEYYYLPLVPGLALAGAFAMKGLTERYHFSRLTLFIIMTSIIIASLRFSIAPMLVIPKEDRYVLEAAKEVRRLVPPDSRIIASHSSTTSFLYYTDRDGWAFELQDKIGGVRNLADTQGTAIERLERFRSQGAGYFALADKNHMKLNPAFFDYLKKHYRVLYDSPHSILYSLNESP